MTDKQPTPAAQALEAAREARAAVTDLRARKKPYADLRRAAAALEAAAGHMVRPTSSGILSPDPKDLREVDRELRDRREAEEAEGAAESVALSPAVEAAAACRTARKDLRRAAIRLAALRMKAPSPAGMASGMETLLDAQFAGATAVLDGAEAMVDDANASALEWREAAQACREVTAFANEVCRRKSAAPPERPIHW